MNIDRIIENFFCALPNNEIFAWGQWKKELKDSCIKITKDDSGHDDTAMLNIVEAQAALKICTYEHDITCSNVDEDWDVNEWVQQFQQCLDSPPTENDCLTTVDGSPVKLKIELFKGKSPFIYGIAYIPTVVGGKVGWFAQSIHDTMESGWKVILMTRSRDEVIKRYGVTNKVVAVQSIRIIRPSRSGQAFLGEVASWVNKNTNSESGIGPSTASAL